MPRSIFQEFILKKRVQEREDSKKNKVSSDRGEILIKKLRQKGYIVLVSSSGYDSIPVGVLVGARSKKKQNSMLGDFQEIADKLGLHFKRGNVYFKP